MGRYYNVTWPWIPAPPHTNHMVAMQHGPPGKSDLDGHRMHGESMGPAKLEQQKRNLIVKSRSQIRTPDYHKSCIGWVFMWKYRYPFWSTHPNLKSSNWTMQHVKFRPLNLHKGAKKSELPMEWLAWEGLCIIFDWYDKGNIYPLYCWVLPK